LESFKTWMQSHFGTVKFGFRTMDSDGSGTLSYGELKRNCRKLRWDGDVKHVFNCLNIELNPGSRTLGFKELAFLDCWEPSLDDVAHNVMTEKSEAAAQAKERALQRSASCPSGVEVWSAHKVLQPVSPTGFSDHRTSPQHGYSSRALSPASNVQANLLPNVAAPVSPSGGSETSKKGIGSRKDEAVQSMRDRTAKMLEECLALETDCKKWKTKSSSAKSLLKEMKEAPKRNRQRSPVVKTKPAAEQDLDVNVMTSLVEEERQVAGNTGPLHLQSSELDPFPSKDLSIKEDSSEVLPT